MDCTTTFENLHIDVYIKDKGISVAISPVQSVPEVVLGQYRRVFVGAIHTLHQDVIVWVTEEGQRLSHTHSLCLPLWQ